MNLQISHLFGGLAALTLITTGNAATIANWKQLQATAKPTSNLDTDGPTFGDGSAASAQGTWIAGRFGTTTSPASVTLSVGQTLTVSGSYVLTGGTNTASEFRHGVFNDGGQFDANSGSNWTGGWLHQPGTDLFQGRTNGAFISSGANAVALGATKSSTGSLDGDSVAPFSFSMAITRDSATTIDIVSSLVGGDSLLDQTYTANDLTTSLFTYTSVGLLFGGSSSVDQGVFSNVQYNVTPIPEPSSFGLIGLAIGALLLRRRRA